MLTLVHAPRSRSSGTLWLLEETGAPYDIRYLTIRRGDGSGTLDPGNPHPHGKVPLLKDGDETIHEQSAIALYLADKFPESGLGPAVGAPGRGVFLTMLAYYSGVIEPAFTSKFMNVSVPRGAAGWVGADEAMEFVNRRLAEGPYIAGDRFTAADVMYAGAFGMFMNSPLLGQAKTPQLEAYVARCVARPCARPRDGEGLAADVRLNPGLSKIYPRTPDGRYFVVRGRLWRTTNPALSDDQRTRLTRELMDARRAVGGALKLGDEAALKAARAAVDEAKVALGERGPVWWADGAPDFNRRMARTTPYAEWFRSLEP